TLAVALRSFRFFFSIMPRQPTSPLFPYTTLFRSGLALEPGVRVVLAAQAADLAAIADARQVLGADDVVLAHLAPRAARVAHLHARAERRADAVQDRHGRDARPAVAAELRLRRIRADHGHAAQRVPTQRQHARVVLQQHDGRACGLARERAMLCMAVPV